MTLHEQQMLFSELFCELVQYAIAQNLEPVIAEVARTKEQQKIYYDQGKTQTLNSQHLKRLAGDLLIFQNGKYLTRTSDYKYLGSYWKNLHPNCIWGGDWNTFADGNHFEMNWSTSGRIIKFC